MKVWPRFCLKSLPPSTPVVPVASARGPCRTKAGAKRRACASRHPGSANDPFARVSPACACWGGM